MPRKKKPKPSNTPKPAKVPARISRPFADALKDLDLDAAKPDTLPPEPAPTKPSPTPTPQTPESEATLKGVLPEYSYDDRAAYLSAFSDVRPLDSAARKEPTTSRRESENTSNDAAGNREQDAAARDRLSDLVSGGIRFEVNREADGMIDAHRVGKRGPLRELRNGKATPEAELDLHGLRKSEAVSALVRFLRECRQRGRRCVLVIHGKGLHSDGGDGVLRDHVYRCLSEGPAAPFVDAFTSASQGRGGTGAVLVRVHR